MKYARPIVFILTLSFLGCAHSQAEDRVTTVSSTEQKPATSGRKMFSVSTEDLDFQESLDRVSGTFEQRTLPKENSYKSHSHKRSDPLEPRSYEEVSS